VIAERGAYTGSPVLMLLGEKDDNLPLAKIESYLAYARAAGNPAPIETGVDGSWLGSRAFLPGLRQHDKMSADSARAKPASLPDRRSSKTVRPKRLRCVRG
jgi:hypothetical protein